MAQQRSFLLFENSIKSDATKKTYLYHLNNFVKFYHIKDYDSLTAITTEKMQIMVEDYVMHLKKVNSLNYINLPVAAIKAFLDCNDIELRWKKIKRLFPAKKKKTGGEAWTTEEVVKILSFTKEIRTKAIIHFLASSGIRIGAIETLKMKNIKDIEDCKHCNHHWRHTESSLEDIQDEHNTGVTSGHVIVEDLNG